MNPQSWFVDTVTVARKTGKSSYGDPTFGAQFTIKARVENYTQLVVDPDGNEQRANHRIATQNQIYDTDRIWLPGDNTSSSDAARRAIKVAKATTKSGSALLYEVWL